MITFEKGMRLKDDDGRAYVVNYVGDRIVTITAENNTAKFESVSHGFARQKYKEIK